MYKFFVVGIHSDKWITCVCCNSTLVVEIPTHQYVALRAPTESPAVSLTDLTIYILIYCFQNITSYIVLNYVSEIQICFRDTKGKLLHPFMMSTRKLFFPTLCQHAST